MNKEIIEKIRAALEGAVCTDAEIDMIYLLMSFGDKRLVIGADWALVGEGKDLLTTESAASPDGQILRSIVNYTVEKVHISGEYHDLKIYFKEEIVVETRRPSYDYENWEYSEPKRLLIVAGPGELWSQFKLT